MKKLVEYVATSLADQPELVKVRERERQDTVTLEVSLAPDDMGRLIGRQGRVANALRLLVKVAAARQGKQAILDITEQHAD
jgi:predicted RNA-binding protein YlqC (UPF0109 family)